MVIDRLLGLRDSFYDFGTVTETSNIPFIEKPEATKYYVTKRIPP